MAKIQLNGRKISIKQKISMFEILQKYKIDSSKVAIELNGLILSKKLYKTKISKTMIKSKLFIS